MSREETETKALAATLEILLEDYPDGILNEALGKAIDVLNDAGTTNLELEDLREELDKLSEKYDKLVEDHVELGEKYDELDDNLALELDNSYETELVDNADGPPEQDGPRFRNKSSPPNDPTHPVMETEEFRTDLTEVLNIHNLDTVFNIPDHVIADFVGDYLSYLFHAKNYADSNHVTTTTTYGQPK